MIRLLAALALVSAGAGAAAHEGAAPDLGAPALLYELPAAGSYELPVIERVSEHRLLDPEGRREPMLDLGDDDCALVAFVYLHCSDASGCPLALASLQRTDRAIAARPDLAGRTRLVTVSFDPERDSPEAMGGLRRRMEPKGDWRFLTAADEREVLPVLRDYGQDSVPVLTAGGRDTGLLRHVTKVFLVDSQGGVRNVYSSGFLDHRLLLRDVETLLHVGAEPPAD